MTARDLATILLRVAGLYLALQVLAAVPALIYTVPQALGILPVPGSVADLPVTRETWGAAAFVIWPVLLYVAVAFLLLRRTRWLVERLVQRDPGEPAHIVLGQDFQAVAISLVGVVLLAGAVPRASQTAVTLAMAARFRGTPLVGQSWDRITVGGLVELGATVLVGLWLCLGARGVARAIQSLRGSADVAPGDGPS